MCKKIEPVPCRICGKNPSVAQETYKKWHCYCLYWTKGKKPQRVDHGLFYGRTRNQAIRRWNRWARKEERKLKGASK